MKPQLQKAVNYFGSMSNMARALGISRQRMWSCIQVGHLPAHLAIKCERNTRGALRRYELNDKVFSPFEYEELWKYICKINNYKYNKKDLKKMLTK